MRRKTRWQIATPTYGYEVDARTAKRREQRIAEGLMLNDVSEPTSADALARLGVAN